MLARFYFLVNLRRMEEAAWLSCKLILLSLLWLPSSFPRGFPFLGDWALHSSLSPLHVAHGHQMFAVCVPGWYWYQNTPGVMSTDVAPLQAESLTNTPVVGTTCFWRPAHSCSLQSVELMGCPEFTVCVGGVAIPHSKYCSDKDLEKVPTALDQESTATPIAVFRMLICSQWQC